MTISQPEWLSQLNPAQYQAVTAPIGPVRVLAGAGSGKTKVLVSRIAWLITIKQVMPRAILAVTFTNKAAQEMKNRLEILCPFSCREAWIGTFHSLCHRFLRLHYREAQLLENFQVIDSVDQQRLIKRLLSDNGIDDKKLTPKLVSQFINRQKDLGKRADQLMVDANHSQELLRIYAQYEQLCMQSNVIDFSEILLRSLETLQQNIALLSHYQQRFQHILVDEFQDTNVIQYQWIKLLSAQHQQVFVVGDDDQSIYGWRGAQVDNILGFDQDYACTLTLRLEQNYRSSPAILNAANHVIARNVTRLEKALWTAQKQGAPLCVYQAIDAYDEAKYVISHIKQHPKLSDCAILYRSNAQSRIFEEMLLRKQIAYRVYGGLRFFDRAEIKDGLSYIRLSLNPHDDIALERAMSTPPKGIGATTLRKLREYARVQQCSLWTSVLHLATQPNFSVRIQSVLLDFKTSIMELMLSLDTRDLAKHAEYCIAQSQLSTHYRAEPLGRGEDRIENLNELMSAINYFMLEMQQIDIRNDDLAQSEPNLSSTTRYQLHTFLSQVTLDSTDHQVKPEQDCVQLMTLHSAKGLEFDSVFLVGWEEGVFPSEASAQDQHRLEEERRLAYVGMTRAKSKLYISAAEYRMLYGKTTKMVLSRFIHELPSQDLQQLSSALKVQPTHMAQSVTHKNAGYDQSINSMSSRIKNNTSSLHQSITSMCGFSIGQAVQHQKFGDGLIAGFEAVNTPHARVVVNFKEHGSKVLVLKFANLCAI